MKITKTTEISVDGLGVKIKELRNGRSINFLATQAGISAGYWEAIEMEQCTPSLSTIQKIQAALGVDLNLPE